MNPEYDSLKRRYQRTDTDAELIKEFARMIHDHVSYHDLVMDGYTPQRARELMEQAAKIVKVNHDEA